jgi:hypothetical protein
MIEIYYYALKLAFFLGILKSYIKFDVLHKHPFFLAGLYTAGIALISFVFLLSHQQIVMWPREWENQLALRLIPRQFLSPETLGWRAWQIWLVSTFFLMSIYLKLLARFEEGSMFWVILVLGLGLILF